MRLPLQRSTIVEHTSQRPSKISNGMKNSVLPPLPCSWAVKPALVCAAVSTILSFIVAVLPHWLEGISWHYTLWVVFALLATSITRLPLYLNPTEKNGYRALKGSMVGAITFFPCLIGVQISLWRFCACDCTAAPCDDGSVRNDKARSVIHYALYLMELTIDM